MRALEPRCSGFVGRDGVRVFYEVYGDGEPTVFLLMPDVIVHSRAWKAQIPFLARSFRVVVIDPRGNGRSDAPETSEGFDPRAMIEDAWSVLDAVPVERAVLVGVCSGAGQAVVMAAERPERVLGVFAINPGLALTPPLPHKVAFDFDEALDTDLGWAKNNRHYWLRDWPGFCRFFFSEMFPEPHSTKQVEDAVAWATQTTPEIMLLDAEAPSDPRWLGRGAEEITARVRCPVFVVTGSQDRCQHPERGHRLAELTGGDHVVIEGGGHLPMARDPVKINLLLRDFIRRPT
jgi:pimeloyl-ACP methyl ester carboxylesterase